MMPLLSTSRTSHRHACLTGEAPLLSSQQWADHRKSRFTFTQLLPSFDRFMIPSICLILFTISSVVDVNCQAAGEREAGANTPVRYSLPPDVLQKPYSFARETIPLHRSDVRYRVATQVNFLLLDARSILIEWLMQHDARGWLLKELLEKEGVPHEFILFPPVLPAMAKSNQKVSYSGIWFLDKPCNKHEGIEMEDDAWHDDRMDIQLATRCFAARIKSLRSQIKGESWLMAAAAYIGSPASITEAQLKWDTFSFWDIPLPPVTEQLITRWIALNIINTNRQFYGIDLPRQNPLVFEQLVGIRLTRDLSIAQISHLLGMPAREVLALNSKIKPTNPVFPAKVGDRVATHTMQVLKGKGALLMEKLRNEGYLHGNQGNR